MESPRHLEQLRIEQDSDSSEHHPMQPPEEVRLDKWLWAVRLYRSRSLATDACLGGHVKVAAQSVKPARSVRVGDMITASSGGVTRTVKVLALLEHRVGAKAVPEYLDDLTPPEEFERARRERESAKVQFPKGWGRPTKKQRRQLEGLWGAGEP
jgi:ribosome-associated heat shock protein Hsp15